MNFAHKVCLVQGRDGKYDTFFFFLFLFTRQQQSNVMPAACRTALMCKALGISVLHRWLRCNFHNRGLSKSEFGIAEFSVFIFWLPYQPESWTFAYRQGYCWGGKQILNLCNANHCNGFSYLSLLPNALRINPSACNFVFMLSTNVLCAHGSVRTDVIYLYADDGVRFQSQILNSVTL